MKWKNTFAFFVTLFVTTGCMSKMEFALRAKDLEAKQKHPATYTPLVVEGETTITVGKGGKMTVNVPTQPFVPANIPDGQAAQIGLVKDVVHTAAIVGGAAYGIHKANGSMTNNITNNNAGTATGGAK